MSVTAPAPDHRLYRHQSFTDLPMAAPELARSSTATTAPIPLPRQHAPYPIATNISSPIRLTHLSSAVDPPHSSMGPARGPAKPLTLQHHSGFHVAQTGLQTPQTPHFRQQPSPHPQHSHHPGASHDSSLPSPPLSSVEPTHNSGFFLKSPLQERCEALESELSTLRLRLRRSERSSIAREKRLSIFQQQSSSSQQSLHSLTVQYEAAMSQLQDARHELGEAKAAVSLNANRVRQLETTTQEQENQLKEILSERELLSAEMKESYAENKKQQRRLNTSTDKVERLQQENRQLIEQLTTLRTTVEEVSDAQLDAVESLDREKSRGGRAVFELEKDVKKYKAEIDRLQDTVLTMGNRHVQVQAQLSFFQQQAQQLQQQLDQSQQQVASNKGSGRQSLNASTTAARSAGTKHASVLMDDSTLNSLLVTVASVASTSHMRGTKPTRRFTVNAPRKDGELMLEQRKCEFLMDQIAVLQRGYDGLRQEKVTLELQLDLIQRQHQYHQQQRQKRRESQRRTLGHDQSSTFSNALAIMVSSSTSASASSAIGALPPIPSTPLLPIISAAEQEREKARIQYELEQAQIQAQKDAQEKEAQQLAAKVAAEEAEREAIRLRRVKSLHLKEALASLESKRARIDSSEIQITNTDELRHLELLRLDNEQQPPYPSDGGKSFQSAAAARASRRIISPFSSSSNLSSNAASPMSSPSLASPSTFSTITTPSPSSPLSPAQSTRAKQHDHYTHTSKHQRSVSYRTYTYDIEQCSCCLGAMIDI
ncbi:hypothetical protein BGZ99_001931 [Dissophora globulifera]|uniref:Uncharacterized protein n=1 Tax=Dissophora globulifera TaxID=979702 RepID=A0A9P6RT09_9FUNG|nr:hypothetical protein BGZ99_001931 [Dissophora globulifera]